MKESGKTYPVPVKKKLIRADDNLSLAARHFVNYYSKGNGDADGLISEIKGYSAKLMSEIIIQPQVYDSENVKHHNIKEGVIDFLKNIGKQPKERLYMRFVNFILSKRSTMNASPPQKYNEKVIWILAEYIASKAGRESFSYGNEGNIPKGKMFNLLTATLRWLHLFTSLNYNYSPPEIKDNGVLKVIKRITKIKNKYINTGEFPPEYDWLSHPSGNPYYMTWKEYEDRLGA